MSAAQQQPALRRAQALVSQLVPVGVHGSSIAEADLMDVGKARARSAQDADYAAFAGRIGALSAPSNDATTSLRGRTVFISGASRGIGLAIALRVASAGANVVIAAKTVSAQPNLPGTIHSAAAEVEKAGGKALAVQCDIRSEESVQRAIDAAVQRFGGIDVLVNNASAISLTGTADTSMKKYDLMHQINARGTFLCTKLALPHLKKSPNPHVLNLGPPLSMVHTPGWWAPHPAYSLAKFGMSAYTMAHAAEFRGDGIAVNSLWPLTTIATAAVQNLLGGSDMVNRSRRAECMADAAFLVLTSPAKEGRVTGQCLIDEHVLRAAGASEAQIDNYAIVKGTKQDDLAPDFFV